jgi:hypothetical protein
MKKMRIASGSAGWPDMLDSAVTSAKEGDIDYMAFDHLAELTMAILQKQKAKKPEYGFIPDVVPLMKDLLPVWKDKQKKFRMVSNGGGANPEAAAEKIIEVAKEIGLPGFKIGVITGDSLTKEKVQEMRAKGIKFPNHDTGEPDIDRIQDTFMASYVYIGAEKIIEALDNGCDLVIGGRISDNSLYCGPAMYNFGWKYEDEYWDRIGAMVCCAHILECSSWSCGTSSNLWREVQEPWKIGFPICEMDENGDATVEKLPGTGGLMRVLSAKEHLVYEVHDPENYLMPDGIGDITALKLEQVEQDKVSITSWEGKPRGKERPETLKFCLASHEGFLKEYTMICSAPEAYEQAKRCEEFFLKRLDMLGIEPLDVLISFIGYNALHGPATPPMNYDPYELGVRFAVKVKTAEEARVAGRQMTFAYSAAGVGCAFGFQAPERPLFGMWPSAIPRDEVPLKLDIVEVK